ncbi:oligogalacturonate-specific porin KdgM family protein [Vibrio ziniensis]|uniref:DUF481 domain-containing protein n=1 Tax=Vibrio ziniensis TaxID=2711221 RepID=A0A6G7CPT3_9VIBR|nr:oligogalacturonate-specific porin KdgM family protein [Vibrio ziniensis]QIH44100.1 DUF481 domain-containing protein [Vibrio ziniensis]
MKKVLTSAILMALASSTVVYAADFDIREEYNPSHGEKNPDYQHKYRIAFNNRLSNGIGFGVEAKYLSPTGQSFLQDFQTAGTQANISYAWKFADDFTLTPQLKIETNDTYKLSQQANLTLAYKFSRDFSASVRYRYNYDTWAEEDTKGNDTGAKNYSEHYNQFSVAASYKGIEDLALSTAVDYRIKRSRLDNGVEKNTVDEDNKGINEINFKAEYSGFDSGLSPYAEYGLYPSSKDTSVKDSWRPYYRVGLKYKF